MTYRAEPLSSRVRQGCELLSVIQPLSGLSELDFDGITVEVGHEDARHAHPGSVSIRTKDWS